jgi:hypothetical protein
MTSAGFRLTPNSWGRIAESLLHGLTSERTAEIVVHLQSRLGALTEGVAAGSLRKPLSSESRHRSESALEQEVHE